MNEVENNYNPNIFSENQKNTLIFIQQIMSAKENEKMIINNFRLNSPYYLFIPSDISIGQMIIISNEEYLRTIGSNPTHGLNTENCLVSILERNKEGKALFLKYDVNIFTSNIYFPRRPIKNAFSKASDGIDLINAKNFPYLVPAIEKLIENAKDGVISLETVSNTLQQIANDPSILDVEKIPEREIENTVIGSLNK